MKISNHKYITLGAGLLTLSTAFGIGVTAQAAPRNNDVREERREVKQARKEVKQERKDVRKADTAAERRREQRELQNAKRDVQRERQDVREERRENRAPAWGNRNNNRPVYNAPRPTWNNRPVYNTPRPGYGNTNNYGYGNNTYSQSDFRQFSGYSLGNTSGSTFQVRADNGTTYTVRSNAYSVRGQRVTVSGYLYNGVIVNARVSRL